MVKLRDFKFLRDFIAEANISIASAPNSLF